MIWQSIFRFMHGVGGGLRDNSLTGTPDHGTIVIVDLRALDQPGAFFLVSRASDALRKPLNFRSLTPAFCAATGLRWATS